MRRAAVIGNFDGVHRGHVHLLARLRKEAARRGLEPVAITFANHPLSVIAPGHAPMRLATNSERSRMLAEQGVEAIELPFTGELRVLTAEEFLRLIHERLGVDYLLMGFNNRIGSDRRSAAGLRQQDVEVEEATELGDEGVSSSAVRAALAAGDVEEAARLLGRPYSIEGTVVHGRRIGRTIGFPTANLQPAPDVAIPAPGVYLGRCCGHRAVVNIGRRPTVESSADAPLTIEAHLLDYSGDLYGRNLRLEFLDRLRGEKKFAGLDELKAAIANDITRAYGRNI